jgi:glutamate decarboxylase
VKESRDHPIHKHKSDRRQFHDVPYLSRYGADIDVPKYKMPSQGIDGKAAYQILHDELDLDGSENLNLASFVGTFATDEAKRLCEENL